MKRKQVAGKGLLLYAVTLVLFLAILLPGGPVNAAKKKYDNWQAVAKDMHTVFEEAVAAVDEGDDKAAHDLMNKAYFGYYETQGFEKNVMFAISAARVNHIEAMFRDIKHSLLGNVDNDKDTIIQNIRNLDMKVYRDALVLDGVENLDSPDEVGQVVFTGGEIKAVDQGHVRLTSFITSFGLLMREGLEAILVCVAIVAYLVKTGNRHLVKGVYWGMAAGILGSVVLAVLVNFIFGGIGQELLEGWTMFLAVIVLFWVSNWMLSRSEAHAWEAYIQTQVQKSVDRRSMYGLIGAAFLAVIREGAELILFYKASLGGGMTDTGFAVLGFAAALVLLVVIYLALRFTSVRLPLRPFFIATSIMLYVLCISFMGKGVKELSEAGVISGSTTIPALNGFSIDLLGIYDRAETLIPQIMILIASAWIILSHILKTRRIKKEMLAKKEETPAVEPTSVAGESPHLS